MIMVECFSFASVCIVWRIHAKYNVLQASPPDCSHNWIAQDGCAMRSIAIGYWWIQAHDHQEVHCCWCECVSGRCCVHVKLS
jgi:hypothetical protein